MKTSITKIFTTKKEGYAGFSRNEFGTSYPANNKSKTIRMKIYIKWGLFLFILTATTSCSKWLNDVDVDPTNLSPATYYQNEKQAEKNV